MAETFRFSPRPNRASEIRWREWGPAAFEEARTEDKPILLNLTAVWCHWCHRMDETTYSDGPLIDRINRDLVPVRVDADRYPHVEERYIAGGWPTNAFLSPAGDVLWAGTYVAAERFRSVANGVVSAWQDRREEFREELERRRKAMDAARSQRPAVGLVRREASDDVLTAVQDAFDPRNGGFGTEPKFPQPAAVEALLVDGTRIGNPDWIGMADRTLDGMLAGELWDRVDGGFFRYALAPDWTDPQHEKLLEVNAEMLRSYALGAHVRDRDDWRRIADRTVEWVDDVLALPNGLWGGSQSADDEYYDLDAAARAEREAPYVDPTLYTDRVAQWIRALAEAGGRLGREDWVERAATALPRVLEEMAAPNDLLHHYREPDADPAMPGLLTDSLEAAHAALAVAQATGERRFLDHAARLATGMEHAFWSEDGGLVDHTPREDDVGAVRYRDRPFEMNASAARLLIDLSLVTGEGGYRALAERILALLSPLAGRYGAQGAAFTLAVEEFFDPPLRVVVVDEGDDATPLRRAALELPEVERRVWSLAPGTQIGTMAFEAVDDGSAAYVCGHRACSEAVVDPTELEATVEAFR